MAAPVHRRATENVFTAGGGVFIVMAVLTLVYSLLLVSQDQTLPLPKGMYYYAANDTQGLLLEGRKHDERMKIAAAEQRQLAVAAVAAQMGSADRQVEGKAPAASSGLPVAMRRADDAEAPLKMNFSRGLMVYDLVFEDGDEWLERIVDRVQLWNKLFLKQRASKNWRVTLDRQPRATERDDGSAPAPSAGELREKAVASSLRFLDDLVNEAATADREQFNDEELRIMAQLFHDQKPEAGGSTDGRRASTSPVPVHIFMAADNGTVSGTHELHYIHAAMRYKTPLRLPVRSGSTEPDPCVEATFGFFKRPVRSALTANITRHEPVAVLAVVTGVSATRAAACTAYVLSLPMLDIQSATVLGTAAASPVVGGGGWHPKVSAAAQSAATVSAPAARARRTAEWGDVLANSECQREWPDALALSKVALGSVCVTHAALLQECGICHEEAPVTSLCSRPRCAIQNSTTFFGPCNFQLSNDHKNFAESMKGAMMGQAFPTVPEAVMVGMHRYWTANDAMLTYRHIEKSRDERPVKSAATAQSASEFAYEYQRDAPQTPRLLNCAEVSTTQRVAGVRNDVLCREYAHTLLHGQLREGRHVSTEELFPREELTCVQAAEGFGVLHTFLSARLPATPVALVRGVAVYDMLPLRKRLRPLTAPLRTRAEVLQDLQESSASAAAAPASAGGRASVGAASRLVRQTMSRKELGSTFEVERLLRRNAEQVERSLLQTAAGTPAASSRVMAMPSEYYYVSWEQTEDYMSKDEQLQFEKASHAYAVETASAVVLNLFLRDMHTLPGRPLTPPQ